MTERDATLREFLSVSGYESWTATPLAGDASSRRYMRLRQRQKSLILMDAAPGLGEDTCNFALIANHLNSLGLAAPEILAHDQVLGVMILTDLGNQDFVKASKAGLAQVTQIYEASVDVLVRLDQHIPEMKLPVLSPELAGQMIEVACTHYAKQPADDLPLEMTKAMKEYAPQANTLALRDYHAENLIWRGQLQGVKRVGLLDFQDAFIAPRGYDLVSLLRDVRREVEPDVVKNTLAYFIENTDVPSSFDRQLATLGVQRNLRILGVFARLAQVHQKTKYLDLIPRVWQVLMQDLDHPALRRLKQCVLDCLPEPTPEHLMSLQK